MHCIQLGASPRLSTLPVSFSSFLPSFFLAARDDIKDCFKPSTVHDSRRRRTDRRMDRRTNGLPVGQSVGRTSQLTWRHAGTAYSERAGRRQTATVHRSGLSHSVARPGNPFTSFGCRCASPLPGLLRSSVRPSAVESAPVVLSRA